MKDKLEKTSTKKSVLDRFRLWYEETHPAHYASPTAGHNLIAPWYSRWASAAIYHTSNFVLDISAAVKAIIKEIK